MRVLSRIAVREFRNLEAESAEFAPGLNILVGGNGQGKTSVLEAIHYAAFLRSFRTRRPAEMINWRGSSFGIEATLVATDRGASAFSTRRVSVSYSDCRQQMIDGKPVATAADFIKSFLWVALVPEDLGLIKGPPLFRRRFLDILTLFFLIIILNSVALLVLKRGGRTHAAC